MPPEWPAAKVILSQPYLDSLSKYEHEFPKLKEIHQGIVWVLARDPFYGTELPEMHDHRVFRTYPASSHTEFNVIFKYDETKHEVILLSISSTGTIM